MSEERIVEHYARGGLMERILDALAATGADPARLTPSDTAAVDHFHARGLTATRDLAVALQIAPGDRVLDIGCGLGGPARYLATAHDCRVEGVDLTAEFVAVAERLTTLMGLGGRVTHRVGSALDLPFADASFDRAYSQNVSMNVADKRRFYAESWRVLRPGGLFVTTDAASGPGGPPYYPVPWATSADASFLVPPSAMAAAAEAAGFASVKVTDMTAQTVAAGRRQHARTKAEGLPPLGVHLILGDQFRQAGANSARNFIEGRVVAVMVLARKT